MMFVIRFADFEKFCCTKFCNENKEVAAGDFKSIGIEMVLVLRNALI